MITISAAKLLLNELISAGDKQTKRSNTGTRYQYKSAEPNLNDLEQTFYGYSVCFFFVLIFQKYKNISLIATLGDTLT